MAAVPRKYSQCLNDKLLQPICTKYKCIFVKEQMYWSQCRPCHYLFSYSGFNTTSK